MLEHAGAEVWSASSVAEALSVLSELTPDVLVTDFHLPDGDGCLLAAKIKTCMAERASIPIPIVALSGYSEDMVQEMGVKSAFQAYLVKPVDIEALINTVSQMTKRQAAFKL